MDDFGNQLEHSGNLLRFFLDGWVEYFVYEEILLRAYGLIA